MKIDKFGQYIYTEDEMTNELMKCNIKFPGPFIVHNIKNAESTNKLVQYTAVIEHIENDETIQEFDKKNQDIWLMPKLYKDFDIASYILDLCDTEIELQRCGEELLLYQEKNLFNLLRYLKYLVDTMTKNNVIWGVGRGSSVSSYILYKLRIHRIDSIFYELDIKDFLRS